VAHHARSSSAPARRRRLRAARPLCRGLRRDLTPMLDLVLGGAVAAGLLVYLVAALLRPENF
jgi:K+-transporting ATPase KdpF subunit